MNDMVCRLPWAGKACAPLKLFLYLLCAARYSLMFVQFNIYIVHNRFHIMIIIIIILFPLK